MTRYVIRQVDDDYADMRVVAEIDAPSADAAALMFARRHYRRTAIAVDRLSGAVGDYHYTAYVAPNRPHRAENVLGSGGFRVSRAAGQYPIPRSDPDHPEYRPATAEEED